MIGDDGRVDPVKRTEDREPVTTSRLDFDMPAEFGDTPTEVTPRPARHQVRILTEQIVADTDDPRLAVGGGAWAVFAKVLSVQLPLGVLPI